MCLMRTMQRYTPARTFTLRIYACCVNSLPLGFTTFGGKLAVFAAGYPLQVVGSIVRFVGVDMVDRVKAMRRLAKERGRD